MRWMGILAIVVILAGCDVQSARHSLADVIMPPTATPVATPTPIPTPTAIAYGCTDAQAAVVAVHKVFWPVMKSFYPSLSFYCDPSTQQRHGATADQPVRLTWVTSKATYEAIYLVAADGTVSDGNATAHQLDEFAKYSPLVLKLLLGGL